MKGLSVFCSAVLLINFVMASSNEIMTVEANILKSEIEPEVSIEVPNYLFFGNLTKGEKSEEFKIIVNNTGNVDVTITPKLMNSSEKFFSYVFFRLRKTSEGSAVPFTKIGDFSFDVGESDDEYFYTILDLTDYPDEIEEDLEGHKTDIRFVAMAKE